MTRFALVCVALAMASCVVTCDDAQEGATHEETGVIDLDFQDLVSLTLDAEGRVLACDARAQQILVIDPDGTLVDTWQLADAPYSAHVHDDGTIYVGGRGTLTRLSADGQVLATVAAADGGFPVARASGMATMGDELFVSFGSGGSVSAKAVIIRFALDFSGATQIAEGLRGCCQRLDMVARGAVLYVAENARHHVLKMDRDGQILESWGQRDRLGLEGFGSCCNPMNLFFGASGDLYTAESGLGRIKRYTADGQYLGLVGYTGTNRFTNASGLAASCSNIALAATADESRVLVLDYKNNLIRILDRIPAEQ